MALKSPDSTAWAWSTTSESAEVFRFVFEQDRRGADAAIISCTNLRTLDVIEPLEKVLGAPVVSSNQASLSGVLRHLGL